eukprot:Skav230608  [mRNA]  locus=scaffold168:456321:460659:- [translate_table: standard]
MAPMKTLGFDALMEVNSKFDSKPFIAWCYERCNKADQKDILKAISSMASTFRASLVCKKKAHGFMKWWSSEWSDFCRLARGETIG